ncbi:hypothetical protein NESM_000877000 [Novymonas esmeraldas]|uniref:Uncharacterized protein n=1 Tax=Novymonas esmeraldas TaxID=1808958 RepID=A0AAW0EZQ4_9TRYP
MDAAATEEAAPPARFVDMLVDDSDAPEFAALATIREAGQSPAAAELQDTAAAQQTQLVTRLSTPERIRRASARLYDDIHAIMDRHDARTGRELELQRRGSRSARTSYLEEQSRSARRSVAGASRSTAAEATPMLPDVHKLFEASRRAHLAEAQEQRTYFPSSSKPTAYSPKNPSTFSYRFQSHPSANGSA